MHDGFTAGNEFQHVSTDHGKCVNISPEMYPETFLGFHSHGGIQSSAWFMENPHL